MTTPEAINEFLDYDGTGICPWCSALQARDSALGEGKAGGDTDHFAACPYVRPGVTALADTRADGKRAGRSLALKEVREFIKSHAISCYRGGQLDRSDCLTELLLEIDRLRGTEDPLIPSVLGLAAPRATSTNIDHAAYMLSLPDPDGTCRDCHKHMVVSDGDDPTPLCDDCAQMFLVESVPLLIEQARHNLHEHELVWDVRLATLALCNILARYDRDRLPPEFSDIRSMVVAVAHHEHRLRQFEEQRYPREPTHTP